MSSSVAVVMAAGKGTRMKSDLPKVLVPVLGRPMIEYVIDSLVAGGVGRVVVVIGYRGDLVREQLAHRQNVQFAEQPQQLGTGHAVMMCREALADHDGAVVIVAGDSPMTQSSSVRRLLDEFHSQAPACLLGTAHKENPTGLGRIVRDSAGAFTGIVEEKDATPEQRQITEVNLSSYVFDRQELFSALDKIRSDNAQGEYYITDCPAILLSEGKKVLALPVLQPVEALSINTPEELAIVETVMQQQGT